MSRNLLGVVRNVPVMASAAVLCILVRFRRMVTDPECLDWPSFLLGGVYQASIPYVILGSVTAR